MAYCVCVFVFGFLFVLVERWNGLCSCSSVTLLQPASWMVDAKIEHPQPFAVDNGSEKMFVNDGQTVAVTRAGRA